MPSERVQRNIERLLDAASDALASSDWQSAFESAEVALGLDPDNPDARSYVEAARRGLSAQAPEPSPAGSALNQSATRPLFELQHGGKYLDRLNPLIDH